MTTYCFAQSDTAKIQSQPSFPGGDTAFLKYVQNPNLEKKKSISKNDSANKNGNSVYEFVAIEEKPEFPGGDKEMYNFLRKNIQYPQKEKENDIQGKAFVTFVIDTDGSVTNVAIYKGVPEGSGIDAEALRVVKLMPKWKPGKQNGKVVKVRYIMPIRFTLQGGPSQSSGDNVYVVDSRKEGTYYYNEGVKKFGEEKYEDALKDFEKALKAYPKDIDALYNKGVCLVKLKKNKEACEAFQLIKSLGIKDADDLIKKFCSD